VVDQADRDWVRGTIRYGERLHVGQALIVTAAGRDDHVVGRAFRVVEAVAVTGPRALESLERAVALVTAIRPGCDADSPMKPDRKGLTALDPSAETPESQRGARGYETRSEPRPPGPRRATGETVLAPQTRWRSARWLRWVRCTRVRTLSMTMRANAATGRPRLGSVCVRANVPRKRTARRPRRRGLAGLCASSRRHDDGSDPWRRIRTDTTRSHRSPAESGGAVRRLDGRLEGTRPSEPG
jgi:hypothetical protein